MKSNNNEAMRVTTIEPAEHSMIYQQHYSQCVKMMIDNRDDNLFPKVPLEMELCIRRGKGSEI